MFLASQFDEFLTIAVVAVFVIAIALVVYYIVTGKKKDDTTISPNFETKPVEPEVPTEPKVEVAPIEPESPEIAIPVEPETPSLEEKALEEAKTDNSIQTLLDQMQQDLDKGTNSYADSINRYEEDEEANAIISYTELMKYKDDSAKNMVLEDKDKEEIKEAIKEDNIKEEVKKFKRSEFISPIFGYNEGSNVTYREIKRPPRKQSENEWESDRMLKDLQDDAAEVIEFEKPNEKVEEIDQNDRFLDELVDFRNKLN